MRLSDNNVKLIKKEVLKLGNPIKGSVYYSRGLYNGASHFINLLHYWLGSSIKFKILNKGNFLIKLILSQILKLLLSKDQFYFTLTSSYLLS